MEKGIVEKGWDKFDKLGDKVKSKILPTSKEKSVNKGQDSSNQKYTQTTDDSVLNKPPHNQSPLNNVDNSINDVAKNVK